MDRRVATYCRRLGLAGMPGSDAEGLAALQSAHRQAITFENIDVLLGRPIPIDGEAVFDKLVMRGRGGYCFEQNRLYADMLSAIGIASRPLLARPRLGVPAAAIPPRTHVLLLAEVAGQEWLADAGFGGSFVPPLPLADGAEADTADGARHRLRHVGFSDGEWVLERSGPRAATDGRATEDSGWQLQYSFDLAEVMDADLAQANHWTSTWPQSRFLQTPIVTRVLPAGFASLVGPALRSVSSEGIEEREISDPHEWREVARERLGLALCEEEIERLPIFAK